MFFEDFKHIYRALTNVHDVTNTTHALGAFIDHIEALVEYLPVAK